MAKKSRKIKKPEPATVADLFTAARLACGFDNRYKMARAISDAVDSEELRYYATIRNIETGDASPSLATIAELLGHVGWELVYDVEAMTITFQEKARRKSGRRL